MSNHLKKVVKTHQKEIKRKETIKLRKHLNADALFSNLHNGFKGINDHRPGMIDHTLADTLMSGFAMFSLKDPSLLAFDERRQAPHNLTTIYGMGSIPCDTSMREILDGVDPNDLRPLFKEQFRALQRGKVMEQMVFMQNSYLLNLDGTGYFSSSTLHSDACMKKVHKKSGKTTYYLQAIGAAIVHPDLKEVIPLCPEIIKRQDGETKMDCERNAVKRFLKKFRKEHPHLQVIVNEDALSSNAPHIRDLEHYNCRYILGVKEGDHQYLFSCIDQAVQEGNAVSFIMQNEQYKDLTHHFKIVYDAPLNKSNQDIRVTFGEHSQKVGQTTFAALSEKTCSLSMFQRPAL